MIIVPYNTYNEIMEIIIDKIAIWKTTFHKETFTVREHPTGTRYLNEANIYCISDKPLYRYAKNYKVGKTEFLLFVRTFNGDKKVVEKQLDEVAKTVKESEAKKAIMASANDFEYLDKLMKGNR